MKYKFKAAMLLSLLSPMFLFSTEREVVSDDETENIAIVEEGQESRCHYIYDQYPSIYLPVSIHSLISVSVYGDSLELEDGSLWRVSSYDGRKAMQWRTDDPLSIVQNTRWFSSYYYRIVNRNTGASIEANISQGPYINGLYTNYVTEYDWEKGLITLASPTQITRWEIHPADLTSFRNWDFTQPIPVVLGDNNDYIGNPDDKWENLLINVKRSKKYIRAHQY